MNMKCDNVNFTSRINFVDLNTYLQRNGGKYIDFSSFHKSAVKADEFYSEGVRTCSGGGLIDTEKSEAAGFHCYDGLQNLNLLDKFIDNLFSMVKNPDRALLVGGKNLNCSPYSLEMFYKIKDIFLRRVNNVTILEEHILPWSETDFHYTLKDDRWDIHSMFRGLDYKERPILSLEELKSNFKNIKIAEGDIITFEPPVTAA